jgi:hypothetical protein
MKLTFLSPIWPNNSQIKALLCYNLHLEGRKTSRRVARFLKTNIGAANKTSLRTPDLNNIFFYRSPSIKSTGSNLSHLANSLRASMRYKVSYASAMLIHHREEGRAATVTILGKIQSINFRRHKYFAPFVQLTQNPIHLRLLNHTTSF